MFDTVRYIFKNSKPLNFCTTRRIWTFNNGIKTHCSSQIRLIKKSIVSGIETLYVINPTVLEISGKAVHFESTSKDPTFRAIFRRRVRKSHVSEILSSRGFKKEDSFLLKTTPMLYFIVQIPCCYVRFFIPRSSDSRCWRDWVISPFQRTYLSKMILKRTVVYYDSLLPADLQQSHSTRHTANDNRWHLCVPFLKPVRPSIFLMRSGTANTITHV